eukprot:sb/3465005/
MNIEHMITPEGDPINHVTRDSAPDSNGFYRTSLWLNETFLTVPVAETTYFCEFEWEDEDYEDHYWEDSGDLVVRNIIFTYPNPPGYTFNRTGLTVGCLLMSNMEPNNATFTRDGRVIGTSPVILAKDFEVGSRFFQFDESLIMFMEKWERSYWVAYYDIFNPTHDHETGNYSCQFTYPSWVEGPTPDRDIGEIVVSLFSIQGPQQIYTTTNTTVTLICEVESPYQYMKVSWYDYLYSDYIQSTNMSYDYNTSILRSSLELDLEFREDGGEFICGVPYYMMYGLSSERTNVTVLALNTSHIPEHVGAPIGTTITLSCGADLPDGVAEPEVRWKYLNDEMVTDGRVSNITEGGVFVSSWEVEMSEDLVGKKVFCEVEYSGIHHSAKVLRSHYSTLEKLGTSKSENISNCTLDKNPHVCSVRPML